MIENVLYSHAPQRRADWRLRPQEILPSTELPGFSSRSNLPARVDTSPILSIATRPSPPTTIGPDALETMGEVFGYGQFRLEVYADDDEPLTPYTGSVSEGHTWDTTCPSLSFVPDQEVVSIPDTEMQDDAQSVWTVADSDESWISGF